jgi:AraC family transcriptional regulator
VEKQSSRWYNLVDKLNLGGILLSNDSHPFLKPFPQQSYKEIDKCTTDDILALRPTEYIAGLNMQNTDYVFTISNYTPPPILIDGKEYQFRKNHLIVYPPDTLIQTNVGRRADKYFCINIRKSFIEDIAKQVTGKSTVYYRLQNPCSSNLTLAIQRFFDEFETFSGNCKLMLQSLKTQLAIEILRNTGATCAELKEGSYIREKAIDIAKDFISTYYSADICIEDLCNLVSLNPYYFIRLFKECTGQTPHSYLLSVRLENAKDLLENNKCSVEEVAGLCGFVSPSHFITCFRRAYGITPGRYRKNKLYSIK